MTEQSGKASIKIHLSPWGRPVFSLAMKVTTANNNILVGGVFHAGVELYGKERGVDRDGTAQVHKPPPPPLQKTHKPGIIRKFCYEIGTQMGRIWYNK